METDLPQPQNFASHLSSWLRNHKAAQAATTTLSSSHSSASHFEAILHSGSSSSSNHDDTMADEREPRLPPWVTQNLNSRSLPSTSPSTLALKTAQGSSTASTGTGAFGSAGASAGGPSAADRGAAMSFMAPPESDVETMLVPQLERLSTAEDATQSVSNTPPPQEDSPPHEQSQDLQQQQLQLQLQLHQSLRPHTSGPSASAKRFQSKYKQPWRRTATEIVPRKAAKRVASAQDLDSERAQASAAASPSTSHKTAMRRFDLPHDVLLAIFSHLPPRANAQQYYLQTHPSDLVACSRVNMAWRIAALSIMWHTILLPDPMDKSCRRLLHLLAASHASAQITGKNYDMTEIVQRVEVDLLEATELLLEDKDTEAAEEILTVLGEAPTAQAAQTAQRPAQGQPPQGFPFLDLIPPLPLQQALPSPSVPQAEAAASSSSSSSALTTTITANNTNGNTTTTTTITNGNSNSNTSDMAAMTEHITTLLEYVSPFRTISIQLPQEIDSNAAEILTRTASTPVLDAIVQGIHEAKIQELDMPSPMYCSVHTFPGMLSLINHVKGLRSLILGYSSRDWPLLQAIISLPNLENLSVFDSCWSNQIWIYLLSSLGPRLRGLTVLQGRRPLHGVVLREGIAAHCRNLTTLSIPFIQLLQGPSPVLMNSDVIPVIKACPGLQSVNLAGQKLLSDPVLEAMTDLWGLQTLDIRDCPLMTGQSIKRILWQSIQRVRLSGCGEISQEFMDLILQAWRGGSGGGGGGAIAVRHFAAVLDFGADAEDPVEMGWVRQHQDEPPLDLNEDHFFADCGV
ncbi:hypothetical protein BGX31_008306 [Mortierella sp. GBA43]|nr:hypothetical protein BGX31_008306 [Mortierella sp. GBA43]